ncbi:cache domain-containing sensor histidine kinase [Paenibacillus sp. SYP-B4298]|uniref:cache domain-containing sensor histidine kinase n=1 Tax=Paenibacillus sp. SYP-B4298 TaxID=2996034 RepID=UPI0022DE27A9|nr:sensor histidine kinase [Paenibacillus sp. SYP-B4298]
MRNRLRLLPLHGVWQRSKLSTLMIACFFTLNLLFLLTIAILAYRSFSDVTFTEISRARLALLNESTHRGFDFMTNMTRTAYSVVSNKEVQERLEEAPASKYDALTRRREISALLHHTLVVNNEISSIEIYSDLFNDVPYSGMDLVYPTSRLADQHWFARLKLADAVWISELESASSDALIGYAQHMFDSQGRTVGYLVIRMSQQDVLKHFADVPMAMDGQVVITDTAGRMIATVNAGPQSESGKGLPDLPWLHEHPADAYDGYEVIRQEGQSYLALYSKPSSVQWRLVQLIPTQVLLASTYKAGWMVMGLGLLILLVSVLLTYLFVSNMIRPLRKLMLDMRRLERGDFSVRAASRFTEEYAQLSYSFNHMVSRLQELIEHVHIESKAKRDAQTSLLEAQIKPHFLYNTLDMIHWRALDYNAKDISFMITQLGKLLRIGLSGGKIFIRLRDELEHARCYVRIQQERLPFSITYTEQIDPQLKGCYIPKIILQPLIENAVLHARPQQQQQELRIELTARPLAPAHGQRPGIELLLCDNGQGLKEGWSMEQATGIGIRNVHQRIGLYCGAHYGLQLANREQGGVMVTIRLPAIETEEQLQQWLEVDNR